jgi:hypothetical protein
MKKTLGFLVLILSALVTACASSSASSQPKPTTPDPEQWPGPYTAQAVPSEAPSGPESAATVPTTRLGLAASSVQPR